VASKTQPLLACRNVRGVNVAADGVTAKSASRCECRAGTHKWVNHGVSRFGDALDYLVEGAVVLAPEVEVLGGRVGAF
jgi:hypothetical protein